MANLSIVDTGYLKTDNSGTRLSTANRANSGSKIDLYSFKINITRKANLDATPNIGSYLDVDVTMNGFDNAGIEISGKIDMNDSSGRNICQYLNQLVKTRGWKALFIDATVGGNELPEKNVIYQIANVDGATFTAGEKTAFGVTTASIKHLCAFFNNVTFDQSSVNTRFIDFRLQGIITKKNASTI